MNFRKADEAPTQPFPEMSVHMGPNDGYGLAIIVGSGYSDKKRSKNNGHNFPHAHICTIDKSFESRFRIDSEKPPETAQEIMPVDKSDAPLGKYAEKIIEWAKMPSIRYIGNNWEAMRQSWHDIQEMIDEGLAQPWYI